MENKPCRRLCGLTFRLGLLPNAVDGFGLVSLALCALDFIVVGESNEFLVDFIVEAGSAFSCELGGSMTSLLGTGVESLTDGFGFGFGFGFSFGFGRELALVVSCRHEEG